MKKAVEAFSYITGTLGTMFSVTDIENVLNIILLVCSVASILLTAGFKIYDKIKEGRYKDAIDDAKEAVENIKDALEDIKDDDKTVS